MSVISAAPPLHQRGAEPAPFLTRHAGVVLRGCAFAALAVFGAVRWANLISPAPIGRALALVAIALTVTVLGPPVATRSRPLAGVIIAVALLASLAVCGLPFTWIRHVRIARSAHAVGLGLAALPQLLVPYRGANPWVHMTILAGAAVLLLDAAAMFAFGLPGRARHRTPGAGSGDLRRAVATVPLITLAAVPLTLLPPRLPYFQGLLLFALLVVAVWGERIGPGQRGPAAFVCAISVLAAMILAPDVRGSGPWINYRALSGQIGAGRTDAFDWSQTYGPLQWPQEGREVLEVRAKRPDYWKAVDLDTFDGVTWRVGGPPGAALASGIGAATRSKFSQWITVDIEGMSTIQLIGAGESSRPLDAERIVGPGASPGTWVAAAPLTAGDSYRILVYSPMPKPRQLAAAGSQYPDSITRDFLTMDVPTRTGGNARIITIPAYDAGRAAVSSPLDGLVLEQSPYGGVEAIARRLREGTHTPYAYVRRVLAYLGHGFTYDQHPAVTQFPLVTFLLGDHRGYCQQFAGAMALLLRMGGVPARVSAGFTTGQYDPNRHRWIVSDLDAHAWVEAFFPGYGWVRFDPTPTVDPARQATKLGSLLPADPVNAANSGAAPKTAGTHGLGAPGSDTASGASRHRGGGGAGVAGVPWPLLVLAALLVAGSGVGVAVRRRRRSTLPPPSTEAEALVRELERAFSRMGRPLEAGTTLAALERRLRSVPEAAAYVAALAGARYTAGRAGPPPLAGRRAMRAYLRSGLGLTGALRALWALPPFARHRHREPGRESPRAI